MSDASFRVSQLLVSVTGGPFIFVSASLETTGSGRGAFLEITMCFVDGEVGLRTYVSNFSADA